MASPVPYTWPLQDLVALVNNVMLAPSVRTFTFNGTIPPTGGSVTLTGISRNISFNSASDLRALTFTVTGVTGSGGSGTLAVISEPISGPNAAGTVYTTNTFNQITSITVSADMTGAVNIGTGLVGFTNWFICDTSQSYPAYGISAVVTGTINYTFETTLDSALGLINANIAKFTPIAGLTAATTTQFGLLNNPIAYCRMHINSSDNTGKLVTNILQQGTI